MQKRLVTRYAMMSSEAADENQRRVEGVFDELAATKPDSVSYIVLRLSDDSFVHVYNDVPFELAALASQELVPEWNVGRRSREARVRLLRVRRILLDPCSVLQRRLVSRVDDNVRAEPVPDGQYEGWSRARTDDCVRDVGWAMEVIPLLRS